MIGEAVAECLCGSDYIITKLKGKNFEATCKGCSKEGITNIIKGTIKRIHNEPSL